MAKMISKTKLIALCVIGLVFIILGAVLGFGVFPGLVDDAVDKNVRLEMNTPQYARFQQLPFPLSFKVYIFNVTNVEEIRTNNAKPIVEEVGPYVYNEFLEKRNIQYNLITDTIDYDQYRTFFFDAEASGSLTEQDVLSIVNVPMVALQQTAVDKLISLQNPQLVQYLDEAIKLVFNKQVDPFMDVTVKQYLWDGYKICEKNIIEAGEPYPRTVADTACRVMKFEGPKNLDHFATYSTFAFLKYKNNTHDGRFSIKAGMNSIDQVGQIIKWEGLEYTKVWDSIKETECDRIHGLDATVYPPRVDDASTFDIFATDICRTSKLKYVGEVEYQGISGLRYEVSEAEFAAPVSEESENSCYCINSTIGLSLDRTNCLPDGFVDMFHCQLAPVLASFPHMLWADEEYYLSTDGQSRSTDKHMNFVELEPMSGSPLRGSKKIQFNMVLRVVDEIPISTAMFPNPSVIPLIWVDEGMELPEFLVNEIDHSLSTMVALDAITWLLIGIGISMVVGSAIGLWYLQKQSKLV